MAAEWLTCAVIIAICSPTFGHFETVGRLWTRIACWLADLAVAGLVGAFAGRPWTFAGSSAWHRGGRVPHALVSTHGIHPLTAEPGDRYEQLRARGRP